MIDDKRLQELLDVIEDNPYCEYRIDTISALKELQTIRKQKSILIEVYDRSVELRNGNLAEIKELQEHNKELQEEVKHLTAYADKLIEPLDYLPKDIENIRKANFRLHEVEQQNKALIEDAERLAGYLKAKQPNGFTEHGLGVMRQHNALMQEIDGQKV